MVIRRIVINLLALAHGAVIISPLFSVSCIGYQSASELVSRLLAVFYRHLAAKHLPTSLTTAA